MYTGGMSKLRTIGASILAALLLFVLLPTTASAATVSLQNISYVVAPHPDDEWQTWALVENSPANYKVFILGTKGEESGFCVTPREGTHPDPVPTPTGKWTTSCAQARINSFLTFTKKMSQSDPSIPGDWQALGSKGAFPANGATLNRNDNGTVYAASRSADVFVDRQGRGAVISFNLGDGDLTEQEVKWAIQTTMNNRAALGINTTLTNYNILGTYYNNSYTQCVKYPHPYHYAVHRAIYHHTYGVVYQSASTCATDPDTSRSLTVSSASANAAWSSTGAFPTAYGWLSAYKLSTDQSQIFMQRQSFWRFFN